jgi:hypothetical protein
VPARGAAAKRRTACHDRTAKKRKKNSAATRNQKTMEPAGECSAREWGKDKALNYSPDKIFSKMNDFGLLRCKRFFIFAPLAPFRDYFRLLAAFREHFLHQGHDASSQPELTRPPQDGSQALTSGGAGISFKRIKFVRYGCHIL